MGYNGTFMGFFNTIFAYQRAPKTMPAPNADDKNQNFIAGNWQQVEHLPVASGRPMVKSKEELTDQ